MKPAIIRLKAISTLLILRENGASSDYAEWDAYVASQGGILVYN